MTLAIDVVESASSMIIVRPISFEITRDLEKMRNFYKYRRYRRYRRNTRRNQTDELMESDLKLIAALKSKYRGQQLRKGILTRKVIDPARSTYQETNNAYTCAHSYIVSFEIAFYSLGTEKAEKKEISSGLYR